MSSVTITEASTLAPKADEDRGLHKPHRFLNGLAVLGFSLPVGAYLWFIQHYGVNVIWRDQWADVNVIAHSYSGTLSLGTLWAPHNENRLLFPNLLVILLAHTTHLNLLVEMYFSALLLLASIALIIWTHKRRSPSTQWILYCPVAILMLSFVQFEDTLSGFQVCWYLVLVALALTLFLLDSPRFGWSVLTFAAVAAVVGSFSAFQGLFIWPVGLILLLLRRRSPRFLFAWIAAAGTTAAVFFYHLSVGAYGESSGGVTAWIGHPVLAVKFFFLAIGDVVGAWLPVPLPWGGPYDSRAVSPAAIVLGVVIVGIAAWMVISRGLRAGDEGPSPFGVALMGFGILFALSIAAGRSSLIGLWYAGTSRYTTFDLLVLVGCYLLLLDRRPAASQAVGGDHLVRANTYRSRRTPGGRIGSGLVCGSLIAIICLQAVLGLFSGLAGGRSTHRDGLATEDIIVNIKQATFGMVERIYFGLNIPFVRQMASEAEKLRLSFLASDSDLASREGIDLGVWSGATTSPVTPWRGLHNGQVVTVTAQHFAQSPAQRLVITECNPNAFLEFQVSNTCKSQGSVTVVPRADGSMRGTYKVSTGRVGDGTCGVGHPCYIEVWSPGSPSLESFAEITF